MAAWAERRHAGEIAGTAESNRWVGHAGVGTRRIVTQVGTG